MKTLVNYYCPIKSIQVINGQRTVKSFYCGIDLKTIEWRSKLHSDECNGQHRNNDLLVKSSYSSLINMMNVSTHVPDINTHQGYNQALVIAQIPDVFWSGHSIFQIRPEEESICQLVFAMSASTPDYEIVFSAMKHCLCSYQKTACLCFLQVQIMELFHTEPRTINIHVIGQITQHAESQYNSVYLHFLTNKLSQSCHVVYHVKLIVMAYIPQNLWYSANFGDLSIIFTVLTLNQLLNFIGVIA